MLISETHWVQFRLTESQHVLDIAKIDPKEETFCSKKTFYNGRQKVCVNFKADTDNFNIVVFRYRNNLYLKVIEIDLNCIKSESLLTTKIYLLRYIDKFSKRCFVLHETTVEK